MSDLAFVALGIVLGWIGRGVVDQALLKLMVRLFASDIGNRRALKILNDSIAKLGGDA